MIAPAGRSPARRRGHWIAGLMLAGSISGCNPIDTSSRPGGSEIFRHYWARELAYLKTWEEDPNFKPQRTKYLEDLIRSRNIILSMRDDQIIRLTKLGYPAFWAASTEREYREVFQYQGVDWTLYADPYGGFQTTQEAERWQARNDVRRCADTTFRTVEGAVSGVGRMPQDGPPWDNGVVPGGTSHYLGTLVATNGKKSPVVWARRWGGLTRFEARFQNDTLDTNRHRFILAKLRGARNWTVVSETGNWADTDRDTGFSQACAASKSTAPSA